MTTTRDPPSSASRGQHSLPSLHLVDSSPGHVWRDKSTAPSGPISTTLRHNVGHGKHPPAERETSSLTTYRFGSIIVMIRCTGLTPGSLNPLDQVTLHLPSFHVALEELPCTETLVFHCRATSAITAPHTPRRTCCHYAYVLITVPRVTPAPTKTVTSRRHFTFISLDVSINQFSRVNSP